MVGQASIFFLIAFELLLLPALHAAINLFGRTIGCFVKTLNQEEVGFVANVLLIYGIARTFAKRQEIDGIEQIGLSHTILPEETVQLGGKLQVGFLQVFIVQYRQTFQNHTANVGRKSRFRA